MRPKREKPEFDQHIVDLSRVTRVTKGGKQLSFRACVIIGDRRGRVGFGLEKGKDVQLAVEKAVNQAKKHMITVPLSGETVPHRVAAKYKAGRVIIMPAPRGSGIIAGSSIRMLLELAGVPNASAKILSKTNNRITNLKAGFEALQRFRPAAYGSAKRVVRAAEPVAVTAPVAEVPVVHEDEASAPKRTVAKKEPAKRAPRKKAA